LWATAVDQLKALKWSNPRQVQRVSAQARSKQEMPASISARKLRSLL
jgi:hypothetical protein